MSLDARMQTGSIGKMFTSAVALSMVAEGSLKLDGNIDQWLGSETRFDRLPNGNSITMRQLLNHGGGLSDHVFDTRSRFPDYLRKLLDHEQVVRTDPRDMMQFILDQKPLFPQVTDFTTPIPDTSGGDKHRKGRRIDLLRWTLPTLSRAAGTRNDSVSCSRPNCGPGAGLRAGKPPAFRAAGES